MKLTELLPFRAKSLEKPMIEAAHAAGKVLLAHFNRKLEIREKKGAGLVTQADLAAEKAIVTRLKKARGDFGFLTEEAPEKHGKGKGRWIIDPLDGTTNFVHGFPMFCVSIAAEWEGQIVAGVIYHPILKDTYTAVLGQGAFLNRKRIQVSPTSKLRDSLLTTGFTYRKNQWLRTEMDSFERLSGICRAIRRPGSAALDLAYTARGVFDGFWERRLSPWDVAAGALLVQEAGGKVTNFKGEPFDINAREILATNASLHEELKKTVAPEFCEI
ncbi:MAG: inositol monophosphatase [Methylotenera sp.]|nr:inositol monophosphatase [Oligoflexia bacterium]